MIRRSALPLLLLLIALAARPAQANPLRVKLGGKTYVTTKSLGGGAWAQVYEGREEGGKGRRVAIKVGTNADKSEGGEDTFNRELRVMKAVEGKHDTLPATTYGIGKVEGTGKRALVMQFRRGGQIGSLSAREAADMALQLIDGIEVLHAEGYWHADITPGNILRDDRGRIKILDFGRAKKLDEAREGPGWSGYSAPEVQKKGGGVLKDIFSIGAMLNSKVSSGALQAVAKKAMSQDPKQRYQSLDEFRDAVKKAAKE